MIRLLESCGGEELGDTHYSRVIRSHLNAYGLEYGFCRFYEIFYKTRVGIICVLNGAVTIDLLNGVKPSGTLKREISEFIDFQAPYSFELPAELIPKNGFSGYKAAKRKFYEIPQFDSSEGIFTPEPEKVFETLGLPRESYPAWLTDTLRRINRGLEELYGYGSAVLSVRFKDGRLAYISDVATPPKDRGKGYARQLIWRTAKKLGDEGYISYLGALEETAGFYEEAGCKAVGEDIVFTASDENK